MSEYKWKIGELNVGDDVYCNDHPTLQGKIDELLISNDGILYAVKIDGVIIQESLISLKSNPDPKILHGIKFTLKGQHRKWVNYVAGFNEWLKKFKLQNKIINISYQKGSVPVLDEFYIGSQQILCDSYRQGDYDVDLLIHLIYQAGINEGMSATIEKVKNNLGI